MRLSDASLAPKVRRDGDVVVVDDEAAGNDDEEVVGLWWWSEADVCGLGARSRSASNIERVDECLDPIDREDVPGRTHGDDSDCPSPPLPPPMPPLYSESDGVMVETLITSRFEEADPTLITSPEPVLVTDAGGGE
jgi:hypothetical protein